MALPDGLVSNPLTDRLLGSPGWFCAPDSPMLIVCPTCGTAYDVRPASLQPEGRKVRCVRCRTVWHAEPSRAEKLVAAAAALAPAANAESAGFAAGGPGAWSVESATVPMSETGPPDRPATSPSYGQSFETPADGLEQVSDPAAGIDLPDAAVEVEGPPIAPADLDEGRPPIDAESYHIIDDVGARPIDLETAAARAPRRGRKRRQWRWSLTRLQTAILLLVIVDAVLVGWRKDVVRLLPQTASFYSLIGLSVNVRGLVFEGVSTSTEEHDGVPILVVEGTIVNNAGTVADVPRLKMAVRNAARQEIYSWTAVPPRANLMPGETVAFRTRLASPPTDSRDVLVRFVTRRDIIAGIR
jgi:predicted Zn finger-like uncharacterized protein